MLLQVLVYFPCCLARLLTMKQCVQDDQRVDRWIDRDSYGYTIMMNKMTVLLDVLECYTISIMEGEGQYSNKACK